MNIKLPISLRLTLWYSALLLLGFVLFGFTAFLFVDKELYDEQFNTLNESAEEISEFVTLKNDSLDVPRLVEETDAMNLQENGIFFEIWADSSDFIYRSRNFPRFLKLSYKNLGQSPTKIADQSGQLYHLHSSSVTLVAANKTKSHVIHIRTGQSVLYVQHILNRIRMLLLFMSPVMLLLAGLSGWLLARRALKPVVDITNAAREISLYQLDKRLPEPEQNDELRQLVQTFNAMIGRIQTGVTKIQQFTADVSHELRTPLTVLRGEIEVTLRKTRGKHEYIAALKSSLKEIYWMEKIVSNLLLLSRADAGKLTLQKEQCDFIALVRECMALQSHQAETKNIAINLQSTQNHIDCEIDVNRMRQVISNLLDNAVKYTLPDGKITIETKKEQQHILLAIKDTGIGISEKDLPFVFDRFYRIDKSRSREQHSSGLGLAISKWIVAAHDGHIDIMSKEGQGTTVRVVLPLGNIGPDENKNN